MRAIQTVSQLNGLQNETYVYAVIVAIAIFVLSYITANLIAYQGGNDRSYIKRRIGWIIWTTIGTLGFWLYNTLYVTSFIKQVAFQHQFSSTNMICLSITCIGSILISLIVMLCFRHSQFGSILGKERNV